GGRGCARPAGPRRRATRGRGAPRPAACRGRPASRSFRWRQPIVIEADPKASSGLTDARLSSLVALLLFVLAAWPLLLVDLPPLQALPNPVATAHIIARPDLYPEYPFNGLFKSNALLTLWFRVTGGHGLFASARAFVAIVLAINALALPLFVLRFA